MSAVRLHITLLLDKHVVGDSIVHPTELYRISNIQMFVSINKPILKSDTAHNAGFGKTARASSSSRKIQTTIETSMKRDRVTIKEDTPTTYVKFLAESACIALRAERDRAR